MVVVQFQLSRRVHSLLVVLKVEAHEPTCMDQGMCCISFFTFFTVLTYILAFRTYGSGYPSGYSSVGRGVGGLGFPFYFWPVVWGGGLGYGGAYLYNHEVSKPSIRLVFSILSYRYLIILVRQPQQW